MYLNRKFFVFFILFFFKFNLINASEKIAFLDLDYVLNNSNLGKKIYNDLESINNKNLSELKQEEKIIIEKKDTINKTKNITSKEKLEDDIEKFNQEVDNYKQKKNKLMSEFQKIKKTKLDNFLKVVSPLIQDYMVKNSIDILFDKKNIFIGKDSKDITNDIIEIINIKFESDG
ncbi:OmpH family outer membrane protein [Candidatus Pelagibacter sp.]|uniref:OmpH family outer membrane protein n=1 Tax=Candidatus Pelagibacter sp. TaxID=2024849 RepID=UPI003F84E939